MKIHLDTPAEEVRIELVPLIDVIFCILVFFLLAALQLTRQQAITVDLPKAGTGQPQMQEMLLVAIDDFGQIYIRPQSVNNAQSNSVIPVNDNQLTQVLQLYHSKNPNALIVLYAPESAKYARVIDVLDRLREVGGDRVALGTQVKSIPTPGPSPLLPTRPGNLQPTNPTSAPFPAIPPSPNSFQVPPATSGLGQPSNPSQFQVPSPNQGQPPLRLNQPQAVPNPSGLPNTATPPRLAPPTSTNPNPGATPLQR